MLVLEIESFRGGHACHYSSVISLSTFRARLPLESHHSGDIIEINRNRAMREGKDLKCMASRSKLG